MLRERRSWRRRAPPRYGRPRSPSEQRRLSPQQNAQPARLRPEGREAESFSTIAKGHEEGLIATARSGGGSPAWPTGVAMRHQETGSTGAERAYGRRARLPLQIPQYPAAGDRHRRRHRHGPGRRRHRPARRVGRRDRTSAGDLHGGRTARPAGAGAWRTRAGAPQTGGPGRYEGRTIRRLAETPGRVLGVYRQGRIIPTDRRAKAEWVVPPGEDGGAVAGEIVLAEPLPHHRLGLKPARIIERLGAMGDARSVSLIVIHTHDIPQAFPAAALDEAETAQATPLGRRTDLRDIPLVTIDGEDARDFDDAVFAEPDGSGFRLIVAIADVAHYVRPGSPLDHAARTRGNSVYFPDRVVPMLPEALSNGWCSLRPDEDRGCLFVELHIDADGRKTAHRFGRGLMRSAARLTYDDVQQAHDSSDDPARASVCGVPRPARRPHRARHARSRPAGATCGDRRRRRRAQRRAAAASRQPSADRGVHGARQRRRRRGTGTPASAGDVSRARPAIRRKARSPARLPARARHLAAARRSSPSARSRPRAAPRRRHGRSARWSTRSCCAVSRRRNTVPTTSAISALPCRAMRISPVRSAATPICWCIAR